MCSNVWASQQDLQLSEEVGKCHGGKCEVKETAIASTKVNAQQRSDGHPEGIFHKHAGMLCCTACSAPVDFKQKQSVTNILRVFHRNRSCKMLNLHWQSQAQKVVSELFPTQIAPQNKCSDLQRLFTLLVIGNPAMKKYLEISSAKPSWNILFAPTVRAKKMSQKSWKSYERPTKAAEFSCWASSCSRRGEQPGSSCAQHGSGAVLFPRGWFTRAWWGKQAICDGNFF